VRPKTTTDIADAVDRAGHRAEPTAGILLGRWLDLGDRYAATGHEDRLTRLPDSFEHGEASGLELRNRDLFDERTMAPIVTIVNHDSYTA